jgi:phosphatidylserine decarboxylase precursor
MNITSVRIIPRLAQASAIAIVLVFSTACTQEQAPQTTHEPVVDELITLLETRPALKSSLVAAIESADVEHIQDLDAFFNHVGGLITWVPVEREILPRALIIYFIINQAPDDALNEDAEFSEWMSHLVRAWGEFLDTPASAAGIESFSLLPNYNIDDYFVGPSGWLTFNQFFAREVRPGKRPVAEPYDDTVIVSPADAVFMGAWPIDEDSNITVKGVNWSIHELLDGSPFADEFRNGIYMHSFLYIDDYHRYHVPVGGVIKEIRNIHGRVYMDVFKGPDGSLDVRDGDTYQFNQERGLVVIDSPELGLVAVLPIGMSYVSSVNLTPEVGAELQKGEEFGYFLFGGSDIVIVFQDKNVVLDAEVGKKYLQGQRIGSMEQRD